MTQRPVIFGEVLLDSFPDGHQNIGGAPFNVAWHLQGLGANPIFISRIGKDQKGDLIKRTMAEHGMDTAGLQVDSNYPTGSVEVSLPRGQPSYSILTDQAYDYIQGSAAKKILMQQSCAMLYHGTLSIRNAESLNALNNLLQDAESLPVFIDVNLRSPYWVWKQLDLVLRKARWLKVNQQEMAIIAKHAKISGLDPMEVASQIRFRYDLDLLFVTCGVEGAFTVGEKSMIKTRPAPTSVLVDTVGAGDAFSAVVILGLLHQWPLQILMERSAQFAAKVCEITGVTALSSTFYTMFRQEWNLPA